MTVELLALGIAAITTFSGGLKPVDNQHFLIHGNIIQVDPLATDEASAKDTQVIVYQDGEIYVAFNTDSDGKYLFNLPINHNYEIVYGGEKLVNKRVKVDAHNLPKSRYGQDVALDMGLFPLYEGVDYSFLDEPVALLAFDNTFGKFAFDQKLSSRQQKASMKCFKQIIKIHG